jgi:hypothetical protein
MATNRQQEAGRRNLAGARQAQNESDWRDLAKGGKTANARPEI